MEYSPGVPAGDPAEGLVAAAEVPGDPPEDGAAVPGLSLRAASRRLVSRSEGWVVPASGRTAVSWGIGGGSL